jgi:acyl carrier protein
MLGIGGIGTQDNFFELGGDSLLATRVVPRLRDAFNVEIQLRELFEASTVGALAARLEDILIEQIDALSDEEAERLVSSQQSSTGSKYD